MIAKINQLLQEVEALKAANAEELEALRIKYLSKKGAINDLMADFRNVAAEQKKEVGMRLNELKNKAQEKIAALKEQFESQDTGCDDIDLTRSAYPVELGTRHPLSIVRNEIIDIFARMGFNIADGPEMEDDWHVFSSMNFAEDHPARDMQDTFFIEAHPDVVLRTHTCRIHSSSKMIQKMYRTASFFAHTHPACKAVLWRLHSLLSACFVRDVYTVMKPSATAHTHSSTK